LYVVDGIPISSQELDNGNNTGGINQQSRVADINPNSIESVTILKGLLPPLYGDSELRTELYHQKGKGKLSVELNSSYSIDEVNVRFKTQDVLDKDLMVISLETPVHPLRYHQQRSCRYCHSWIVFCIRSRKYLLRYYEKNSTDNFSTSNYDGIIGSGYTSNQNLSLSGGENGSFT
jgi:hypothetical protein